MTVRGLLSYPHAREDIVSLRGIVDLLEDGPATICEIEMAQHIGGNTRRRLLVLLEKAGVAERERVTRIKNRQPRQVPTRRWLLTEAYRTGQISFSAERILLEARE